MTFRPRHISKEDFKVFENRVRGSGVSSSTARFSRDGAGARPVSPSPYSPYANKWELNYSKVLAMELQVKQIQGWRYGGVTFTLSKGQYHRIDFLIWHLDNSIELAQVKGYHPNMRAGIKGLKWAAQLHPWFVWTIKWWTGQAWDGDYVRI